MDIYRFFHPHHNPRLHSTALRQQELSELEQAAAELRKSLERAQQRTSRSSTGPIMPSHFTDIIKAMRFVEASLQTLCDAHPGDDELVLAELIRERSEFSGWEAWTNLLREQLQGTDGYHTSGSRSQKNPFSPLPEDLFIDEEDDQLGLRKTGSD